jgi:fumarate hydratase subunit beta
MQELTIPLSDETIRSLKVGDSVTLSGVMMTGRDAVHKWMIDTFIKKTRQPQGDDREVYEAIKPILKDSVIYHCGPVVAGLDTQEYQFVAAGPTTSIREEPYQGDVMRHFGIKGVIGKGGMGPKSVKEVLGVYKLDFGVPEAMWVIKVKQFPVVVTMDSHSNSLHAEIAQSSKAILDELLAKA